MDKNHELLAALARIVRVLRNQKGWTQLHLAARAGVDLATIQRIERQDRDFRVETLDAVLTALECPHWSGFLKYCRDHPATSDLDRVPEATLAEMA